ncbi:MAG: glycosyltransferase family 2 protein [Chitinophagales bacterium]|jgi:glycosyltransferase involved in cell wall biosynthesis|nr:glycosyltransferase family 2 protein [Chitinophagales bacterium]
MYNNQIICVVIPALNEEASIGKVIDAIPAFVDHIIVVNDGSSDRTEAIARSKGAIVVTHAVNKGLGIAFKSGVQRVLELGGDVMVNMDADGQFNPQDIEKLILPIVQQQADFVTASRFKNPELYPQMSSVKFWGNQRMSQLISRIVGKRFYDVSCGFRAYSYETLLRLNLFGKFTYTQETFIDLAYKGLTIEEVPVVVRGTREFGKSRMASNLFKYAYNTSKIILKTLRDYNPFPLFLQTALVAAVFGLAFATFLGYHYLQTGEFSPHKWAGFVAAGFFIAAMFLFGMGFVMDMFTRMRRNQEELLYYLKKAQYDHNKR